MGMRQIRRGIEEALEMIKGGQTRLVLEFPTGYGKSIGGALIYKLVNELNLPEERVIHVLPLRAIVENLAVRMYNILGDNVAYQAGIHVQAPDGKPLPKSPLFSAGYNVTTFDSFIHNLYKVPVTEVYREYKHYYIPFEKIYTSAIIMDEAHLLAGDTSMKTREAFRDSICYLASMGNPIIIMTATLTESLRNAIRQALGNVKFLRLGPRDGVSEDTIYIHDSEFETIMRDTRYVVKTTGISKVIDLVLDLVGSGKRILVVINSVPILVGIYRRLREAGIGVGLIHAGLTRRDRVSVMQRLSSLQVLLGTSAVEAGVDASFDALITVPDDPAGLVQRVGRVCRYGECNGELYLICNIKGAIRELCEYLKEHGDNIQWRLPYDLGSTKSYVEVLERFGDNTLLDQCGSDILRYLSRAFVSQGTINYLFELAGYNLARNALLDVYVKGVDEFRNASIENIILDSYTTSIDKLPSKSCIEAIGYISDDEPLIAREFDPGGFYEEKDPMRAYSSFVRKYRASPILITKPECYRAG